MSTCFEIQSSTSIYSVTIEEGLYSSMLNHNADEILIADRWFDEVLNAAGKKCIFLPASETSKSLDAIPDVVVSLRKLGANRRTSLVALGGGIIQDIVSFIASVYMRGLTWRYFPTTLLAMVDSCIGGKSSINVGPYKNLVGTFHPPESVMIDPVLAMSLDDERRIAGLIEAAKICFCRGEGAFQDYLRSDPGPALTPHQVAGIAETSLSAKKWFIEIDEFDKAERLLLNFGHTFGHALEGASHFEIEHGIAVGLGILCALRLGRELGVDYAQSQDTLLLERHLRALLEAVASLAEKTRRLSVSDMLDRFQADKKHGPGFYTVILVTRSGQAELRRLPKDDRSLELVTTAFQKTIEEFSRTDEIQRTFG